MKSKFKCSIFLPLIFALQFPVSAQLIPDRTLGNQNSIVNQINNLKKEINGGAVRDKNLFHSFQEFNVNTGESIFFNAPGINNIFTRVTGNNVSNIFGTLGVNGNANLFLINPNGVIFNQNAKLNLRGSFTATTAESLFLQDGLEFSAINPQSLATGININFPINFGFGNSSKDITVNGNKHNLNRNSFNPLEGRNSSIGIELDSAQNFNLMARNIIFNGGIVTVENGKIQLQAIQQGNLILNSDFTLLNSLKTKKGDIQLKNRSLIDTSITETTANSKGIFLEAKNLNITEESLLLSSNSQPNLNQDIIKIIASESLNISSTPSNTRPIRSGILTEGKNRGRTSNIYIKAPKVNVVDAGISSSNYIRNARQPSSSIEVNAGTLELLNSGRISSSSYNQGAGSNLIVNSEKITISDISPFTNGISSGLFALTAGFGKGGNINVNTGTLEIAKGGLIQAQVFSENFARSLNPNLPILENSGNINIESRQFVKIDGFGQIVIPFFSNDRNSPEIIGTRIIDIPSAINAASAGITDGGNITIKSPLLEITNQAEIGSFTTGEGTGGNINFFVDNILLNNEAIISTSSNSARGGTITVNKAELVELRNDSRIQSNSEGETIGANAGSINITSTKTFLNASLIETRASSGNGGNINLKTKDLRLLNQSQISASVGRDDNGNIVGAGNGGNIGINALPGTVLLKDRSTINADAVVGDGGNINITASALFSDRAIEEVITASSAFGNEGIVTLDLVIPVSQSLTPTEAPKIETLIAELADNECISLQRNQIETLDISEGTKYIDRGGYRYWILEPDPISGEFTTDKIIEPHFLATRKDGSHYFGGFCIAKSSN